MRSLEMYKSLSQDDLEMLRNVALCLFERHRVSELNVTVEVIDGYLIVQDKRSSSPGVICLNSIPAIVDFVDRVCAEEDAFNRRLDGWTNPYGASC